MEDMFEISVFVLIVVIVASYVSLLLLLLLEEEEKLVRVDGSMGGERNY